MHTGKCLVAWIIVSLCYIGLGGALKDLKEGKIAEPLCSNCNKIQRKCTVSHSGLFCKNKTDKEKILFSHSLAEKLYNLDECVPHKYNVTGKCESKPCTATSQLMRLKGPILDWCCLWSPKLGCQQLAGIYYQNQSRWRDTCEICLHSCICDEDTNGVVKCSPTAGCLAALGILGILLSRSYLWSWDALLCIS